MKFETSPQLQCACAMDKIKDNKVFIEKSWIEKVFNQFRLHTKLNWLKLCKINVLLMQKFISLFVETVIS